jgi:glutathione S-transferase
MRALENFLGNKKYFFGDRLSKIDTIIFAFMAQLIYYDQGQLNNYLTTKCPNLIRHFKTIKDRCWPEWSDKI